MLDVTSENPQEFWEEFYHTKRTGSSGRPTGLLVRFAGDLAPGRALDLGASHGDDVIWLAERGWQALGLDISVTAVARAQARAAELGLGERARFEARDLGEGLPDGPFDLVTAFYLQSPVELDRAKILTAAAARVAPEGHLLVVTHASAPPWAGQKGGHGDFPTLEEELAAIERDRAAWTTLFAGEVEREATGPEGEKAMVADTVVFLRRAR